MQDDRVRRKGSHRDDQPARAIAQSCAAERGIDLWQTASRPGRATAGDRPVSPSAIRPEWWALLLLLYVVAGASLIVMAAGPITLAMLALTAGPAPSDRAFEIAARGGIGLVIVALALAGMLIAREWPNLTRLGSATIGLTALPAGLGALTLVMASAWIGGVAIGGLHHGPVGGGLFTLGSLLILLGVLGEELLLRGLLQPVLVRDVGATGGRAGDVARLHGDPHGRRLGASGEPAQHLARRHLVRPARAPHGRAGRADPCPFRL